MSRTPLPDLERELVAAATRLEARRMPRRWWRHSSALLSIALVAAGAGVAVARVAHVGPFAYLDRFASSNPKLAAVSTITVQAPGSDPAWKAVAQIDKIGELCMTGGPRDPRANPGAHPTTPGLDNPPSSGMTCSDSDSVAEALVDPRRPGATFASSNPLDGSVEYNRMRPDGHGHYVHASDDHPTRALVFAAAAKGVTPVVRWGPHGAPIAMTPSSQRLRFAVDKSPAGLDAAERRTVATYPDEIEIVLWAAEVPYPAGVKDAQVVSAAMLMPDGADDATIEMLSLPAVLRRERAGRAAGWTYDPGITREAIPVRGVSRAERAHVAALARARTAADAVPHALREPNPDRVQYDASRRLTIVGGGLSRAWVAPGGFQPHETETGLPRPRLLHRVAVHRPMQERHPALEAAGRRGRALRPRAPPRRDVRLGAHPARRHRHRAAPRRRARRAPPPCRARRAPTRARPSTHRDPLAAPRRRPHRARPVAEHARDQVRPQAAEVDPDAPRLDRRFGDGRRTAPWLAREPCG